jgi:ectoine hydroxylase-related dioxygenase (phytanoyl-CoA dioxygenase family)
MCRTQEFPGWMDTKISDCFQASFTPNVESGDVLMWPPYLKHGVFTGNNSKMRMTFAFNLVIK